MSSGDRLRFVLVTGFGLGLAPVAPGTFGTLAGVVPAVLIGLALHGRELAIGLWVLAGVLLAFGCAQTDFSRRTFHKEDPGPFVLDEVVGYLVTVAVYATLCGDVSPTAHAVAFLAFRAFDVVKPPGFAHDGDGDGSVTLHRTGDGENYAAEFRLSPLEDVAGKTKVMADEFIAKDAPDVTDAFVDYLKPLLGSGMPEAFRLEAGRVRKILNT